MATVINGTNGADLLGNLRETVDTIINGLGGNDILFGGSGNDTMNGGADSDALLGGDGSDRLNGDDGGDVLDGGAGDDFLFGGAGIDSLLGGLGNDQLSGGVGSDTLNGGNGDDLLNGGGTTAREIDRLTGGGGKDTFVLGKTGQAYYVDSNVRSVGNLDYALLQDFNSAEDIIQLAGSPADYVLDRSPFRANSGTAIYLTKDQTNRELIAVVQNVTLTSLVGPFQFLG